MIGFHNHIIIKVLIMAIDVDNVNKSLHAFLFEGCKIIHKKKSP